MASWMRTRAASAATALGLMMASLTPALSSEGERVVQRGKASCTLVNVRFCGHAETYPATSRWLRRKEKARLVRG